MEYFSALKGLSNDHRAGLLSWKRETTLKPIPSNVPLGRVRSLSHNMMNGEIHFVFCFL